MAAVEADHAIHHFQATAASSGQAIVDQKSWRHGTNRTLVETVSKFVFIHRNPYEVFYSNRKLWNNVLQTVSLQKISAQKLDTIILELYEKLHRCYFEQKQLLYDNQIAEVRYEDLKHHPIRELSEVYDKLELPDFRQARPHFSAFMAKNQRESVVRQYEYQPADLAKVNAHWDFAFQKWGYAMHESAGSMVKPIQ